jgi:phage/plasmid-like protein (TIGR03299 family)
MAHELFINDAGQASMAYVGDAPWHGLGQQLTENSPIEVWAQQAGMDYYIESAAVHYPAPITQEMLTFEGKKVLFRNDTGAPLSIVSDRYKVVQPLEVLEFFRNLTENHGWSLETAGVLYQGQKYWALARTNQETRIMGQDLLKDYVLLATSCDGTLRTMAKRTSIRVVCNNTLTYAAANGEPEIRISHASKFDANAVQNELGIGDAWEDFARHAAELAIRKVSNQEAINYVLGLFGDKMKPIDQQPAINTIAQVLKLYDGEGKGSKLQSANGTAWGLVNSVTEYIDHHKGRDQSRRLDNAWFGKGGELKVQAYNDALALIAA